MMKAKRLNLIIIGFSIAFLLMYIFKEDGVGNLTAALSSLSARWISGTFLLMGAYWFLEAYILHLAVKKFHPEQQFRTTMQTSMIGQFFNCITPFSSGGQPMQAYHMVKTGVPLGVSSCSLMLKFIVYQFVLTIYSATTLLFHFKEFSQKVSGLSLLVLLGFGVNTAVILGLLSICFFSRQTKAFLDWSVHTLEKFHLCKDGEKTTQYIHSELENFYSGFQVMRQNIPMIAKMAGLSILQLTSYFLIPYFIFRAFHLNHATVTSMVAAEAFVLNVTSFVPLPGAAGGAEFSFHSMFGMFFPAGLLNVSILLWRIATFYFPIVVGMIFTLRFTKTCEDAEKKNLTQKCEVREKWNGCIRESVPKPKRASGEINP